MAANGPPSPVAAQAVVVVVVAFSEETGEKKTVGPPNRATRFDFHSERPAIRSKQRHETKNNESVRATRSA